MPNIPRNERKRPWKPERKPFDGRSLELMPFYNSKQWRKLRKIYLSKHPLCAHCLDRGETVPAVHVDHIEPITKANLSELGLKWSNLQALCLRCHNTKTAGSRLGHYDEKDLV